MALSDLEGGLISPQLLELSSPTILRYLPLANPMNALSNQCSPLSGIKMATLLWSLFPNFEGYICCYTVFLLLFQYNFRMHYLS